MQNPSSFSSLPSAQNVRVRRPNDKDHRPRASDVRLETAMRSRGSVHPLVRRSKCPLPQILRLTSESDCPSAQKCHHRWTRMNTDKKRILNLCPSVVSLF